MSKIISTKKINAGFLAIVLVAGTIFTFSPSFMVGVHAEPYYGMDTYDDKQSYGKDNHSYDKSKDSSSSVSVKKIKCNNINANLNGFNGVDINALPTALRGLATEAQASDEDEIDASSSGSGAGRPSGSDSDSRVVCINNNNFVVIGDGDGNGGGNVDLCEGCFDEVTLTFPITVTLPPLGTITIEDFEELCNLIFSPPFSTSAEQLLRLVEEIVPANTPQAVIDDIVCNCLVPLLGIQGACPPGPPT